jgi:hypothetical protein
MERKGLRAPPWSAARDKRDTSADLSFGNNWRHDAVIRNWGTMRCRSRGRSMRQIVPAQPVDATPSNALIRPCFPERARLFGCTRSNPSQGSVPADLTLASDLAFVFNASRVRHECCVDPLRPPEFTDTDKSSILGFRPYETNSPRFQCSWKKVGGVCVFGGVDAAVGAGVGLGFEGCGHGLLRWGDVSAAWAFTEEKFRRYQFGEGCADGWLRASWAEGGNGLQHGVLPSRGSGCDRGDYFCAAESSNRYCIAPHWSSDTRFGFFGEFFCF